MKKIISCFILFVFGCILLGISIFQEQDVQAESNSNALTAEYSMALDDNYEHVNDFYHETFSENGLSKKERVAYLKMDSVYAVGKNIAISKQELQQYVDFYVKEGLSPEEAYDAASKDAEERNALYVEAIKCGYTVTDEEIYAWLDELREILEEDTTGVYQTAMEGFDSEEAYWDYEFEVYTVDLPIQKYAAAKEQEFYRNNPEAASSDIPYNAWAEAYGELKRELAENQNFQVVD